uniref:Histone-lysine N-methyltransferase n=1 Tax=Lutzomyia longipalpis TaxID=7200 RepID=A0A1B0EZK9_LUTLO
GDFDVHRPVYVELDRRRKKSVEPGKVQFAIGSLAVRNIGRFVPILSDLSDVIVPSDFLCTRLYWSTKEPWKIVEYTIRTSIQCTSSTHCMDLGKNFTVDHSSTTNLIQKGLNQIAKWHSSLSNGEDSGDHSRTKQNMDSVGGGDEQGEEEPQSNADLLPPEIKEAIFEDLPHDILDGISMLDIFPKLMTYEDLVAMDSKSEIYFGGELIKDAKEYVAEDDEVTNQPMENWSHSSTVTHVEDPLLSSTRPMSTTMAKELKRSKSEVFNRGVGGSRNHQRSSSLTWNCKVDQNTKRRKVSMLQELRLPESVFRTFGRSDIKASTSGEMVIEYAGELIRATLTDKREHYYESKGIGCYMFRIDDNFVVDATMRGNAARFINHSCEPNCYSKVVDILGHKHIIIFALRRIVPGEELTYDYKFPFEDVKIPCSCGSKRCRKYLN